MAGESELEEPSPSETKELPETRLRSGVTGGRELEDEFGEGSSELCVSFWPSYGAFEDVMMLMGPNVPTVDMVQLYCWPRRYN